MALMIPLAEFQAGLPDLIEKMVPGEEIWITKDDEVLAKLHREPPRVRKPAVAGSAKGMILYMSEDFDAPLEEFKEYMDDSDGTTHLKPRQPGCAAGQLLILAEDDEHLKDFTEYMP